MSEVTTGSLAGDVDNFYLIIMGALVFFMQAGFALLEAGSVSSKSTKNILMKNLLDACIGALIWWGWGYGIAYNGGTNRFIGTVDPGPDFFTQGSYDNGSAMAGWWFQYVFCATAATIVSGAMAERTTLVGYLCYTVGICGFIYPVVVYWSWSGAGWANYGGVTDGVDDSYFLDFAGSGIVHMTGGVAAICGAATVGPRKGRFDENKKPLPMPGHNTTFQVLGCLILWLGWYGFNPGSTLGLSGQSTTMARCVITTTLAAATGGITVLLTDKLLISKVWDVGKLVNGILAGLVSITAGTASVFPWAAVIMAFLGGFVYIGASALVLKLGIDDPVDAFAVHGACGFWGTVAAALFAAPVFNGGEGGLFYGDGKFIAGNLLFLFADIVWTTTLSLCIFLPLKFTGMLRISADVEDAGMDVSKHGGAAYTTTA